jgi:hypothetical protein
MPGRSVQTEFEGLRACRKFQRRRYQLTWLRLFNLGFEAASIRAPGPVSADGVIDGIVSPESAGRDYGGVVSAAALPATVALRAGRLDCSRQGTGNGILNRILIVLTKQDDAYEAIDSLFIGEDSNDGGATLDLSLSRSSELMKRSLARCAAGSPSTSSVARRVFAMGSPQDLFKTAKRPRSDGSAHPICWGLDQTVRSG